MRTLAIGAAAMACVVVSGCQKVPVGPTGSVHSGRYQGVGLYAPGRMWSRGITVVKPKDPGIATTADDNTIIVVVDSSTGEIRQCGNLSGYCITMHPWASPLSQSQASPLAVTKHDAELEQEDKPKADNVAAADAAGPSKAK